jgi:hypothetical protein
VRWDWFVDDFGLVEIVNDGCGDLLIMKKMMLELFDG